MLIKRASLYIVETGYADSNKPFDTLACGPQVYIGGIDAPASFIFARLPLAKVVRAVFIRNDCHYSHRFVPSSLASYSGGVSLAGCQYIS